MNCEIHHGGTGVFTGLPSPLLGTRYHSLVVERESMKGRVSYSHEFIGDAACKAAQYCAPAHGENIILVCRVIIGRSHLLRYPSDDAFAPDGFHSTRVRTGVTCKLGCKPGSCTAKCLQLHNEVIVYNDCDVYPEFVLGHTSPAARHLSEYGINVVAAA